MHPPRWHKRRREGRLQLADRLAQRLNGLEGGQSEEGQECDQHAVEAPLRMRLNADREHDDDRHPGHEQAQGVAEPVGECGSAGDADERRVGSAHRA